MAALTDDDARQRNRRAVDYNRITTACGTRRSLNMESQMFLRSVVCTDLGYFTTTHWSQSPAASISNSEEKIIFRGDHMRRIKGK